TPNQHLPTSSNMSATVGDDGGGTGAGDPGYDLVMPGLVPGAAGAPVGQVMAGLDPATPGAAAGQASPGLAQGGRQVHLGSAAGTDHPERSYVKGWKISPSGLDHNCLEPVRVLVEDPHAAARPEAPTSCSQSRCASAPAGQASPGLDQVERQVHLGS